MPENPTASASQGRGRGCFAFVAAIAIWQFLLNGFVSPPWVLLTALGAVVACGGLYLTVASSRHALESPWYAGAFGLGLLMLVGAAATLAPGAKGREMIDGADPNARDSRESTVLMRRGDDDLAMVEMQLEAARTCTR